MKVPQHIAIILDGNGPLGKVQRECREITDMPREAKTWSGYVRKPGGWG